MRNLILVLGLLFVTGEAFARALYILKGKVTKIEDGRAFIQTETGEKKLLMKRLSKKDQLLINEAISAKKEITLGVLPEALKE